MEAYLTFFIDPDSVTLSPEHIRDLDAGFDSFSKKYAWLSEHREEIGLPNATGFWIWDADSQRFYIREANGNTVTYVPGGFPIPSWVNDLKRWPVTEVHAKVTFFTDRVLHEGEYELTVDAEEPRDNHVISGVLDLELLSEGRRRYVLHVRNARVVGDVSHMAGSVRSQTLTPSSDWS